MGKGQIPTHSSFRFYGFAFFAFAMFCYALLYMDLNSMYMHMLLFWYCYCYSFELFLWIVDDCVFPIYIKEKG